MKLQLIEKEKFKAIFDKVPAVVETDYGDIMLSYWIHEQPIMGVKVIYRFQDGQVMKQYYYVDLTEIYASIIRKITMHTMDYSTDTINVENFVVQTMNQAIIDEFRDVDTADIERIDNNSKKTKKILGL
jgi:hypothetical protein